MGVLADPHHEAGVELPLAPLTTPNPGSSRLLLSQHQSRGWIQHHPSIPKTEPSRAIPIHTGFWEHPIVPSSLCCARFGMLIPGPLPVLGIRDGDSRIVPNPSPAQAWRFPAHPKSIGSPGLEIRMEIPSSFLTHQQRSTGDSQLIPNPSAAQGWEPPPCPKSSRAGHPKSCRDYPCGTSPGNKIAA